MARAKEATPLVALRELEKQLEGCDSLPRIMLTRGPENWFHQRALDSILRCARRIGMDVNQHDPADPDFDGRGLFADLRGGSLFGAPILVVIRQQGDLLKKAGTKDSDLVQTLKGYVAASEPPGAVVIQAGSLRADHAVAKMAAQHGASHNFRRLYDSPPSWGRADPRDVELVHWIRDRASERGLKLRPEEAVYLASAVGNDLGALESELKKLAVTGTDELRRSVGWRSGGTPWEVADKVLEGEPRASIAAVEGLFSHGFQGKDSKRVLDPSALVAMLTSSLFKGVRTGLAASEGRSRGYSQNQTMAMAGVGGAPKSREQALQKALVRPGSEWAAMLDDLLAIERRLKTGVTVDGNDFALFAIKWRKRGRR